MRGLCFVLGAALAVSSSATFAGEPEMIAAARRQLELAQLKLRLYERDEYPRQLGNVERAIVMAKAEVESFRRRVREYEQFDKFTNPGPLLTSLEDARLCLVDAELKLRGLDDERFLLIRSRSDRTRIYQLEIEAAAAQFNALLQQP
jgi:hypothetical protein